MSIKILSESEIKQVANSYQVPAVLFANPKNLYQRRAKRLRDLAQNHPLSDYLLFAADIVESQLSTLEKNPLPPQQFEQLNDIEPLNAKTFKRNSIWREYLTEILDEIKPKANEQVAATIEFLEKASSTELEEMANKLLFGPHFPFIGYKQPNKFLIIAKLKTPKISITVLFVAHCLLRVLYKLVHHKVYATYIVIYVKVNGI